MFGMCAREERSEHSRLRTSLLPSLRAKYGLSTPLIHLVPGKWTLPEVGRTGDFHGCFHRVW